MVLNTCIDSVLFIWKSVYYDSYRLSKMCWLGKESKEQVRCKNGGFEFKHGPQQVRCTSLKCKLFALVDSVVAMYDTNRAEKQASLLKRENNSLIQE